MSNRNRFGNCLGNKIIFTPRLSIILNLHDAFVDKDWNNNTMKILLRFGAIYFLLMSIAHFFNIKVPGLFVYFNVPSTLYQDRIISALLMGLALLFGLASIKPVREYEKLILISNAYTLGVLIIINVSTNFEAMTDKASPLLYHLQVLVLAIYWISLFIAYKKKYRD